MIIWQMSFFLEIVQLKTYPKALCQGNDLCKASAPVWVFFLIDQTILNVTFHISRFFFGHPGIILSSSKN